MESEDTEVTSRHEVKRGGVGKSDSQYVEDGR